MGDRREGGIAHKGRPAIRNTEAVESQLKSQGKPGTFFFLRHRIGRDQAAEQVKGQHLWVNSEELPYQAQEYT